MKKHITDRIDPSRIPILIAARDNAKSFLDAWAERVIEVGAGHEYLARFLAPNMRSFHAIGSELWITALPPKGGVGRGHYEDNEIIFDPDMDPETAFEVLSEHGRMNEALLDILFTYHAEVSFIVAPRRDQLKKRIIRQTRKHHTHIELLWLLEVTAHFNPWRVDFYDFLTSNPGKLEKCVALKHLRSYREQRERLGLTELAEQATAEIDRFTRAWIKHDVTSGRREYRKREYEHLNTTAIRRYRQGEWGRDGSSWRRLKEQIAKLRWMAEATTPDEFLRALGPC